MRVSTLREDLDAITATISELDAALTKAETSAAVDPDVEAQRKRIAEQKAVA